MTVTMHNNTVSLNVQETLPILLRMVDPEEFAKYDSMTPTTLDFLANYEDAVEPMTFQIDEYEAPANAPLVVSEHPYIYHESGTERYPGQPGGGLATRVLSFISHPNNVLAYDQIRPAGGAYYHKPRGSWKLKRIWAVTTTSVQRLPLHTDDEVYVQFDVCEPLLLSPFIFGSGHGKQGFYGIQAMNFQMVMTGGNANRAWRSAKFRGDKTATVTEFRDSQLLFQFITPHASDMLDPRNVVPYYEIPVYRTTGFSDLAGRNLNGNPSTMGYFDEPEVKTLQSASIQLNCIPDKLIICVRKTVANLICNDTDSYATIQRHLHQL